MTRLLYSSLVFFTLVHSAYKSAGAQTAPAFRFEFKAPPGTHATGFKVVEQFDRSRSFQAASASVSSAGTEGFRPIQTLVWYPAEKSSRETMTLGDYGALIKTETSFGKPVEQGKPQSFVETFMHGTTDLHARAIRDATMQTGPFAVLIYAPSVNAPATENIELCEYLASHGFVVIASPSMGAHSRTMTLDLPGADAEAQDISFLIDFAATQPNTDMSKVAVIGYSWGGMSALFASSRDKRIGALVSLDGSFRYSPETVQQAADIHPEQMKIPLLVFSRAEEPLESWDALRKDKAQCMTAPNVLNEWTHGDLLHIHLLAVSHIQFSSLYQRSERFSKEGLQFVPADYTLQDGMESYNWMARYLLEFLDSYLKHDPTATQFMTQTPIRNGVPKHLISVSLRRALVQQGQNDRSPKDARRP